jgi:6-phosphogluconolactonase (cycloisomerase 2 family)
MKSRDALVRGLVILGIVSAVFLAGCGGGMSANTQPPPQNPIPAITTISPTSFAAGSAGSFTLTINGTNFVATSTVDFGGMALTTTFVSSRQLTATIPAPATLPGSVAVTVTNPAPGGGTSNAVNFTFTGNNPVPTVSSLNPGASAVGGGAFTLTVSGSNFVSGSVVRWNGSNLPTTFNSSSELVAQVPASNLSAQGTATITVSNPTPGGGISNSVSFYIVLGLNPVSVAVAPDPTGKFGKFVYVANASSNNVSMYTIKSSTGTLSFIGTVATETSPSSVTVDAYGKFAYVANASSDNVSLYTIDAVTGTLTSAGITTAGVKPGSVTVHPSGKFAYVANSGSNNVSMYTIDSIGALTPTGMAVAGTSPTSMTVDPTGRFAYVANAGSNNVSMYTINSSTGALTSIGTVAAGMRPNSVAVHPSGNFTYVADCGGCANLFGPAGDVRMYTIDSATGVLKTIGTAGQLASPTFVAVHPSGRFAYVIDLGDGIDGSLGVRPYSVDGTTGTLTLVGSGSLEGVNPVSMAFDPSGKFAYVVDQGSNAILMYTINLTSGALTLIGTVGT